MTARAPRGPPASGAGGTSPTQQKALGLPHTCHEGQIAVDLTAQSAAICKVMAY